MGLYPIGGLLRRYRTEHNISQQELCDGICSVPTLSRIENGERLPTKANFDALMQRMGYSGEACDIYCCEQEYEIHEIKYQLREVILKNEYEVADGLLKKLVLFPESKTENVHKQFVLYMSALIESKGIYTQETIEKLEAAIKITIRHYGEIKICNLLLTCDEIRILNSIAVAYGQNGNLRKAIQIFYELKDYMEERYISSEEKIKFYPGILYNLSKALGLEKRYDECIDLCDFAIKKLNEYRVMSHLGLIIFNKVWCMIMMKKNSEENLECRQYLLQAYYIQVSVGDDMNAKVIKEFTLKHYPYLSDIL